MKILQIILLFIAISTSGIAQEINATCNFPKEVNAGSDFTVELTLKKKNLRCYAEFTQKLPAGFTIIEKKTAGAEFGFVNGNLKLVWLRLPADEVITVTYKVKADKKLKGPYKINGELNYIVENNKGVITFDEKEINVLAPVKQQGQATANIKISCLRDKITYSPDLNAIIVTLVVNKGNLVGPGMIQEMLPADFTAEAIDCKNAVFSTKNKTISINWASKMPAGQVFKITYKLIPSSPSVVMPEMKGKFTFTKDKKAQTVEIIQLTDEQTTNGVSDEDLKDLFK